MDDRTDGKRKLRPRWSLLPIVAVFAMVVLCGTSAVHDGNSRIIGGDAGPIKVEGEHDAWTWVVVTKRDSTYADRVGAAFIGDWFAHGRRPTGSAGSPADITAVQHHAWALANAYAGTANCTATTTTCTIGPPDLGFNEHLSGTSFGLIATLAYLDHLVGGDLNGGLHVAATGVARVSDRGLLQPVYGVPQKLEAARAAGADIMFVPAANAVPGADTTHFTQVPVTSVDSAVSYLCSQGSTKACQLRRP